ncbi:hypothetical protein Cabys_4162 [Caldithrix abyssi DSM 13497]|uniref:Uncharacterized protein n=1 Tax=Caldithrix abyssi DSM 13497 TaxID=880073 RepID=A0A1J1CDX0_CALAY|nr:hypothetical protein Cabys_4162 [Caldithrix abyssi DSM 13497]
MLIAVLQVRLKLLKVENWIVIQIYFPTTEEGRDHNLILRQQGGIF